MYTFDTGKAQLFSKGRIEAGDLLGTGNKNEEGR